MRVPSRLPTHLAYAAAPPPAGFRVRFRHEARVFSCSNCEARECACLWIALGFARRTAEQSNCVVITETLAGVKMAERRPGRLFVEQTVPRVAVELDEVSEADEGEADESEEVAA